MGRSDRDAVLDVNDRFYSAFERRDLAGMDAVWADDPEVSCVHPGWPPIRGRQDVLRSWKAIFESTEGPTPTCDGPTCHLHGDSAYVLCRERLGRSVLIATNMFARRDGRWVLVHHHASPLARVPQTPELDPDLLPN